MKQAKDFDFGAKLKELEVITAWFESEDADLEEGLRKFERGMELAGTMKQYLATVENRITTIKQRFDGNASGGVQTGGPAQISLTDEAPDPN